ncbi:MAG: hypothetical protein V7K97_14270 [Nostoc sp.]|uniref:hypothetical protein n=1 Tax=Nostoc sp. TaxID=1180 RepID=UPI002FF4B3D6
MSKIPYLLMHPSGVTRLKCCKKIAWLGSHCVARVSRVVASGVGGFAKANILIYVELRSAPPNLRLK